MQVKFHQVSLITGLFVFLLFSSCKKMGCREENAMNYEVDAKKDDGSCVYDGNLTVWFSPFQSTGYVNAGKSELIFYINNEIIGSISTTEYSSVVPTCGMANTFSTTISIGKIDSKDYTLIIRDDLNNFIAQKNFRLVGNGCTVLQVP